MFDVHQQSNRQIYRVDAAAGAVFTAIDCWWVVDLPTLCEALSAADCIDAEACLSM